MKGEILLQNVVYLFIVAVILEACIMAIFSINVIKEASDNRAIGTAKDIVVMILAFIICYKVPMFTLFRETGIKLPDMLDIIISALVLSRMTHIISNFFEKIRNR